MKSVIKLMNSDRKEIGIFTLTDGHSMEIDLNAEFAYMDENIQRLGESIHKQVDLPLRTVRKEDNRVMVIQECVGKDDERYADAVVEFINSSRTIVPRIFAVHEKHGRRDE